MDISLYTLVDEVKSPKEIIPRHVRVQTLNSFKIRIDELERKTLDKVILDALSSIILLIEDAYNIDMYKFQFQMFIAIIGKELKNIEDMIAYSTEE